jgi:hypothetical protein
VYANAAAPLRPRPGAGTLLGHSQVTVPFKGVLQHGDHNREAMLAQTVDTTISSPMPKPKPPTRYART